MDIKEKSCRKVKAARAWRSESSLLADYYMPFREVELGIWPQRSSTVPRRRPTSIETTPSTYKHVCSRAVNLNKDLLSRDSSTARVSSLSNEGGLKYFKRALRPRILLLFVVEC